MKTLTNYLLDLRFKLGSWIVPRTVYGTVLETSLDAAFNDVKVLETQLAKKAASSTSAKCNCGK